MYINRELTEHFLSCLKQFPTILVTGPRQSGKSTFLSKVMEGYPQVTFDDPLNRDFALQDPNGFLDQFSGKPVVLDEIQYVPQLLQYIKIRIDRNRDPGIWIMSGSQQFHLMKDVSESLAGRIAILELAPFSLSEPDELGDLENVIWGGLYPEPFCYPEKREVWLRSYIQTYIERDVRQLDAIRDYQAFELFLNRCAASHSQEFHSAGFARDCGVSQPTIKSWSRILDLSYICIMVPPFYKNYNKRLVKSPKLYFSDASLVCYFTRQPSPQAALRGNLGGALFEGLIVNEVWRAFFNSGKKPAVYFWRSQGGLEVDLIIQAKGKFWPIEIKLTSTPTANHTKPIMKFMELSGSDSSDFGAIVCGGNQVTQLPNNCIAVPWHQFPEFLRKNILN